MRLFLDSADPQAWAELWPLGLFKGITTNPTLLRRSGHACEMERLETLVVEASALNCPELHLQAWGTSEGELLTHGRALRVLDADRVVVKLPLTEAGLRATRLLLEEGTRVTLTACYSAPQALAAAAVGATYVAPYLGRISDGGRDGCAEVIHMGRCLQGLGSATRLLVASLRSLADLTRLAADGIDTFTISPHLARQLWCDSGTTAAVAQFERDADGETLSCSSPP